MRGSHLNRRRENDTYQSREQFEASLASLIGMDQKTFVLGSPRGYVPLHQLIEVHLAALRVDAFPPRADVDVFADARAEPEDEDEFYDAHDQRPAGGRGRRRKLVCYEEKDDT